MVSTLPLLPTKLNKNPMTTIRIRPETHQQLKQLAQKQGSKLTDLLHELVALLTEVQLAPAQIQAKLATARQWEDFHQLLIDQRAKLLQVMGQQERNYLFPVSQELARIQERLEQVASGQMDLYERIQQLEQLLQANKQILDKQYQLLLEV